MNSRPTRRRCILPASECLLTICDAEAVENIILANLLNRCFGILFWGVSVVRRQEGCQLRPTSPFCPESSNRVGLPMPPLPMRSIVMESSRTPRRSPTHILRPFSTTTTSSTLVRALEEFGSGARGSSNRTTTLERIEPNFGRRREWHTCDASTG